jgi:hypothetical protein
MSNRTVTGVCDELLGTTHPHTHFIFANPVAMTCHQKGNDDDPVTLDALRMLP